MLKYFCSHKWEILSETTTKSKCELATLAGISLKLKNVQPEEVSDMLEYKYMLVVSCAKCGSMKRFVEKI